MNVRQAFSPTNIALVAVFAGLIAASTLWAGMTLPGGINITLQTLAVILAGAVLGPWRGASAVLVYLILGTAGLPIFSGRLGGPAVWQGRSAGFLIGFVLAAFVTGWIVRRLHRKKMLSLAGIVGASVVGAIIVLYPIGWGYFMVWVGASAADTVVIALPFLPGDIIKLFLASVVAYAVHRAYPWLLADAPKVDEDDDEVEPVDTGVEASA